MGQVTVPEIDDNVELVRLCRATSPAIDEYFDNSMYLAEVQTVDEVTPLFLRNIAISKMIAELEEMGIIFHDDFDEIAGDNYRAKIIVTLRQVFDAQKCRAFIVKLSDDIQSGIQTLLEESVVEDIVSEFIELIYYNLPTDELWQFLDTHKDLFGSNAAFQGHLKAIMNIIIKQQENNRPDINDLNIDETSVRLQKWQTHVDGINNSLQVLAAKDLTLNRLLLIERMHNHDVSKLQVLDYDTNPEAQALHHKTNDHHFEYFTHWHERPIKEQLAIIVCDEFDDDLPDKEFLTVLKKGAEIANFTDSEFNVMLDYAKILMTNKESQENK